MRLWPWQREKEAPSVDMQAIRAEAAHEAQRAAAEILREAISSSPMPGAPTSHIKSRYPLYSYDNPIWYSTPQPPTRRPQSQINTQTLRQLADTYDVLRDCIQHLKREVHAVPLQIVSKDEKDATDAMCARIKEAEAFFGKRGGLGGIGKSRAVFEGEVIEDLAVIGAAAIYYQPTRGGTPYQMIAIDAATIRPRVDGFGWPGPGEDWYEQWIQGVLIRGFTPEELTYEGLPINARSYTPYYASPVEWLVYVITSALNADQWNRTWLTDGSSVQDIIALPAEWTPDNIRDFAEYWDSLKAGNSAGRQKTSFVPGGSQKVGSNTRKDQDFQEFELWLMRRTCAMMGVQPASIGFAGEQYKVSQQDSMESTSAFGVGVLLDWRKAQYDDLLERLGYDDLETRNVTAREEKATERADRNTTLVTGGIKTPNEGRQEEGLDPIEGGDTLFIPTNLQPIDRALEPPDPPMGATNGTGIGGSGGNRDSGSGNSGSDTKRALIQWERKAINRLRVKRSAVCEFQSESIAPKTASFVTERLAGCQTPADVRGVFRNSLPMTSEEAEERSEWAERVLQEIEVLHRYNHNHGDGGKFSSGGGSGVSSDSGGGKSVDEKTPSPSAKSILAKNSAVRVGADIQRYSEEHNEPILAAGVKGLSLRDNEPIDIMVVEKGIVKHGIELKTMVSNSNNKITMKASAMERKAGWMHEHKADYHTVVFDDHAAFNAGGEGKHDESKRQIYYKRGFGSFRVNGMHPVKDMAELKSLLDTPTKDLPKAAQPPKDYPQ